MCYFFKFWKIFDDIEMLELVEKPLRFEEKLDVIVPTSDEKDGNQEDNITL